MDQKDCAKLLGESEQAQAVLERLRQRFGVVAREVVPGQALPTPEPLTLGARDDINRAEQAAEAAHRAYVDCVRWLGMP